MSGIVDELNLDEIIDSRLDIAEQNEIMMGEAVKGMIVNGLGFSNRPLMVKFYWKEFKPHSLIRFFSKRVYYNPE